MRRRLMVLAVDITIVIYGTSDMGAYILVICFKVIIQKSNKSLGALRA